MLLADAMPVRPTVVPRMWSHHRSPPPRRSRRRSSLHPIRRIHQFLLGCGEGPNGGREGQICSRELLEDDCVVGGRKSQVVECCFKPTNCWVRHMMKSSIRGKRYLDYLWELGELPSYIISGFGVL